jgi:predicted alpha/beta-fold hydrolase
MPQIKSTYNPPFPFKNAHFSTIYSAKLRPLAHLAQDRERINLPDGDFMDIDWSFSEKTSHKLAILLHGLEGSAHRAYIKGTGKILIENGWDVAAVNYRGCSGEMNTAYQSYNAGKTDDLETVIDFILKKDNYKEIALVGFSLGGNLLLKYLGERETFPKEIKKAVAISTPLKLKESLEMLNHYYNWVYRSVFLTEMKRKYREKIK